jgi:uncharacterized OsmC-like protein
VNQNYHMKEIATVEYVGRLRTEATHLASGNQITNDAPTDNKGKGEAFSPTDMVATALATCMITVMGIRAQEENWDFKATATVSKEMASGPRRISGVKILLQCEVSSGSLAAQVLEKVGKACPVAKSLHPDLAQEVVFEWD